MVQRSLLILFAGISIIAVAILLASSNNTLPPPLPLIGKSNQALAKECVKIQVLDKTFQWDQKVMVSYTNVCAGVAFQLTKTGMKYKQGKKIKYLTRSTPLMLDASSTETLELSIPFGITPRVAYALTDDVTAVQSSQ